MEPLDKLTIDTPEQTALDFPLAGVGSRFLALAADTAIQIIAFAIITLLGTLVASKLSFFAAAPQWIGAAVIVAAFLIYYGYFAFFEAIWNGQTPGKRYAQLRVIKDDGRPISAYDSIARNLLRIVDQFPVLYGVGILSVFVSHKNKRLGDFLAGTVVVHEKTTEIDRPFLEAPAESSTETYDISRITADELRLIETFLQRRDGFDPELRGSMAAQISLRIGEKVGARVFGWPANEKFLEAVHAQYRAGGRFQTP
jgi:uncharacterized RDD family membrane protein YckC